MFIYDQFGTNQNLQISLLPKPVSGSSGSTLIYSTYANSPIYHLHSKNCHMSQNPGIALCAFTAGVYRRSIFKIRPNILIGLQNLWLRPKDRSRLFIYWNFLRQFSFVLPYTVKSRVLTRPVL